MIWVPGLSSRIDPITNGHIDGIACFVRPGVVMCGGARMGNGQKRLSKEEKTYFQEMAANRQALENAIDAQGRRLEIIDIPDSDGAFSLEVARKSGDCFCNSYINFYLTNNGGLIAPSYSIQADDEAARRILEDTFPDRRVVMVDIVPLATGGGGIHCITQQQPKVFTA